MSLGIFCRFTFAIFALPLGIQYISLCYARSSDLKARWKTTAYSVSGAAICALVTAILHITFDTWYYSSQSIKSLWPPIVVPINAALYNLRSDNLAVHGLHPRWLHFFVNAPMIVGIGPWWCCISMLFRPNKIYSDSATGTINNSESSCSDSLNEMLIKMSCSHGKDRLSFARHPVCAAASRTKVSFASCVAMLHPFCNLEVFKQ
jgi:phosphatidylinositol glycan class Z